MKEQKDIALHLNAESVGFARSCNEGIAIASKDRDVFILGGYAVLPPNALFWLRMGLYANGRIGAAGSMSNQAGNQQQAAMRDTSPEGLMKYSMSCQGLMQEPYVEKLFLEGFALLLSRETLETVGSFDERFFPGGYEVFDYGIRVMKAGYKNILCKNSFILHFAKKSADQRDTLDAERRAVCG